MTEACGAPSCERIPVQCPGAPKQSPGGSGDTAPALCWGAGESWRFSPAGKWAHRGGLPRTHSCGPGARCLNLIGQLVFTCWRGDFGGGIEWVKVEMRAPGSEDGVSEPLPRVSGPLRSRGPQCGAVSTACVRSCGLQHLEPNMQGWAVHPGHAQASGLGPLLLRSAQLTSGWELLAGTGVSPGFQASPASGSWKGPGQLQRHRGGVQAALSLPCHIPPCRDTQTCP